MTLKTQAAPFINASGLMGLSPDYGKSVETSDNGVLFTGEYVALLYDNYELYTWTRPDFAAAARTCMREPGLIRRSPISDGYEGPDDLHGMLLIAKYCDPTIAKEIIDYGWKHWGIYNPHEPGKWHKEAAMFRFPQLILAAYMTAPPKFDLRYYLLRPFLIAYTALVIYLSGKNEDPIAKTDSRLLSWCLIRLTEEKSFVIRQVAKIWRKRLLKDYGPEGMKNVAAIYFNCTEMRHPFRDYFPES